MLLLSSYVPFFLVPFGMMLDMAWRLNKLVNAGARAEEAGKRK
jgi:hypothetical protein